MKNAAILLDRTLDFLIGDVKKVSKKTFELGNDSRVLKEYYIKEYNQKGQRIRSVYYKSDGTIKLEQISEFDQRGLKIGYKNYDKNRMIDSEGTYEVDNNGNILKKYFNGSLEEVCCYDNHGRLIEQIFAHSRDRLIYQYEGDGQFVTEQTNYMRGEKKYIVHYTNDEQGNILKTETLRFPSMEKLHIQIYIINDRGDVIEEYVNLSSGEKVNWEKFEYDYDTRNNWIKRVFTNIASNSKRIDERQVEYY